MNLADVFQREALAHPERPAVIEGLGRQTRLTTYGALDAAAARGASLLREAGLQPGDGVLLLLPMSSDLYSALGAIFRLQLVAMFVDPSFGREHVERCCEIKEPKALIGGTKAIAYSFSSRRLRQIPHKFVTGPRLPGATAWSLSPRVPAMSEILACPPDTPALLTFTSGSTGAPKAVLRTHGFLLAQNEALRSSLEFHPGDLDLTTLPIVVLANLASGLTCVIPRGDMRAPGAIDPKLIVDQILTEGVTRLVAGPALLERVAGYCIERKIQLARLRRIYTGGGPVFPGLLDRLLLVAPAARITAVYGSTEAEPIAHIDLVDLDGSDRQAMRDGRGLLAGHPVAQIRVSVIPNLWGAEIGPYTQSEFAGRQLPAEQAGEITVCGDHVLTGYVDGRGDAETKFRVDDRVWHRTGDAGYWDERGRLWLLGRCAAVIKDARGELYPFTVECALSHIAGVLRSAVVARSGDRVLAVELDRHADLADVRRSVRWADLDDVIVVPRIPVDRRHNAKVDYAALAQLVSHRV
jgi:acyl-CoA synthetase (AMP-forming)/AMP-acid ligase II